MEELNLVQKSIFKFIRRLGQIYPDQILDEFKGLHQELLRLTDLPFERRPFLYLDIISWLESKIQNRPVGVIIREKAQKRLP